ncbi:MAG: hypothetical protein WAT95_01175, partial [Gemmiger qucibialis]
DCGDPEKIRFKDDSLYLYKPDCRAETPGKAGAEQLERQTEPAKYFAACRAWVRSVAACRDQRGRLPGAAGAVLK